MVSADAFSWWWYTFPLLETKKEKLNERSSHGKMIQMVLYKTNINNNLTQTKFTHPSVMRYNYYYRTLNKITQFWLVESSTIIIVLRSRLPMKFPRKQCVSGILMALFLPNQELFTNFVMFNHAWKHKEDRWNYFQCHTKLNLQVAPILVWFWWLCYHVNWKITSFSYSS